MKDSCQIYRKLKPRMKKDRENRLKFLLVEAVVRPLLELSQFDLVLSAATSVRISRTPAPFSLFHTKEYIQSFQTGTGQGKVFNFYIW